MKNLFIILLVITSSITASAQGPGIQNLVGKWDAVDAGGAHGTLEIKDSTNLFLQFNGQKKAIVHYTVDFDKKPVWFDFAVKEKEDTVHLKSIIRIISDRKLQWQILNEQQHPGYFMKDKGDMVYLVRRR